MAARTGPRSPTRTASPRSAASRWRPRTRTFSTSAAARAACAATSPTAMASTDPTTPARPGRTWACATPATFRRVLIDPRNPDVVLVAALGHAFAPNAERGVFRTTDGGKTWTKVLYVDDHTGATDLAIRSLQSQHRVRRHVPGPAPAVDVYQRRPGQRPVSLHRWRRHLEEALGQRTARGHARKDRRLRLGRRSRPRLRPDRGRKGRPVPLRRRRRQVGAGQRRRALPPARLVFQPRLRRPQKRRHRLRAQHRHVPLHRRRQDLHPAARAARRSPRLVDRPHQSAAHDQRRRWRRHYFHRRRQELDAAVEPAHGAVLPRRHRQPLPVLPLRRAAGQHRAGHRQPGAISD